ncbi:MAG: cytochrome c maturation protein CcmE [Euryarchaeota archaeon]
MLTHRTRLLLIGAVLTIALGSTLLLQTPEATRTIDEVMESPSNLEGKEIAIRGEILDYSINETQLTFIIHGEDSELLVDYSQASVSNGLDNNRTVYAEGVLIYSNDTWIFEAEVIKTSCPSKYEEAE